MQHFKEQLILGGAAVALLALFAGVVAMPQQRKLVALGEARDDLQRAIAQREEVGLTAPVTQTAVNERTAQLTALRQRVPQTDDLGPFLELFDQLAGHAGISSPDVRPRTAYAAQGVWVLPIDVTFKSSFRELYDLLEALETQNRLVRVTSLQTWQQKELKGELMTELSLEIYYTPA